MMDADPRPEIELPAANISVDLKTGRKFVPIILVDGTGGQITPWIMAHEIGHAFGLAHTYPVFGGLMAPGATDYFGGNLNADQCREVHNSPLLLPLHRTGTIGPPENP